MTLAQLLVEAYVQGTLVDMGCFTHEGIGKGNANRSQPVQQVQHVLLHSRQVHAAGSQKFKCMTQHQLHMGST